MCGLRGTRSPSSLGCISRVSRRSQIGDSLHAADEAWIAGAATAAGAATTAAAAVTAAATSTAVFVVHLDFDAETLP